MCAANLGEDVDTTAAVCGQIAVAYYGMADIPKEWRAKLYMLSEITLTAESLYNANPKS